MAKFPPVTENDITLLDSVINNVSASKHGFAPKLTNTGTKYLRDDGSWQTPASDDGLGDYGDGSDGAVTISADTNLSRDMYYTDLTINSGKVLSNKGYRICCNGTLTNNGTIDNSGGGGGDGSSGVAGTAGVAATAGSIGGGGAGAAGKVTSTSVASGGGGGGAGDIFIAAKTLTNNGTIKSNGGKAGNSYAGAASTTNYIPGNTASALSNALGGISGAGGNTTSPAAASGGAAVTPSTPAATETGYRSLPFAAVLRLLSAPATLISGAPGGSSGALACATGTGNPSAAGGSGGGGGGLIVLIYNTITLGTVTVDGGTHSNKATYSTGAATDGGDGSAGKIIQIANA